GGHLYLHADYGARVVFGRRAVARADEVDGQAGAREVSADGLGERVLRVQGELLFGQDAVAALPQLVAHGVSLPREVGGRLGEVDSLRRARAVRREGDGLGNRRVRGRRGSGGRDCGGRGGVLRGSGRPRGDARRRGDYGLRGGSGLRRPLLGLQGREHVGDVPGEAAERVPVPLVFARHDVGAELARHVALQLVEGVADQFAQRLRLLVPQVREQQRRLDDFEDARAIGFDARGGGRGSGAERV